MRLVPAFIVGAIAAMSAQAHDPHTDQINEQLKDARNKMGGLCCDAFDYTIADGWERTPTGYRILIKGEWLEVPPGAYVENIRNPYSDAIVWLYPTTGKAKHGVRCVKEGLSI